MNKELTPILEELSNIRILLEFLAEDKIIEKIIESSTSKERRKIWTLLEGKISTEDIANECGISRRAVQFYIKELSEKNLIVYDKRGFPRRKIDIIPNLWRV